jgi:hypothetical protein
MLALYREKMMSRKIVSKHIRRNSQTWELLPGNPGKILYQVRSSEFLRQFLRQASFGL